MIRRLNPVLENILIQRKNILTIKEALMDEPISALEKEEARKAGKTGRSLTPEEIAQWSKMILAVTPVVGDAIGLYDAIIDLTKGDTEAAKLALLSAVPVLGAPADVKRYVGALEKLGVKNADKVVGSLRKGGTETLPKPETAPLPYQIPDWQTPKPPLPGQRPIEVPKPGTPGYPRPMHPGPPPGVPVQPKPTKPPEVEPTQPPQLPPKEPAVPTRPPEIEPTPIPKPVTPSTPKEPVVPTKPPEVEPQPTPKPITPTTPKPIIPEPQPKPFTPPKVPKIPRPREFDIPGEGEERETEETTSEIPFEKSIPFLPDWLPDTRKREERKEEEEKKEDKEPKPKEEREKPKPKEKTVTGTDTEETRRKETSQGSKIDYQKTSREFTPDTGTSIPYDVDAILDKLLGKYSSTLRIK
jgi:hypothetical protein